MKIAFLSHTAMGGSFVVGSHHLAAAFAARGYDVQHVSAPISPVHVLRIGDAFVRRRFARWWQGGETLARVRDVVPLAPLPWALARIRPALMRTYSRWMLAAPLRGVGSLCLPEADYLVVDEPRFLGAALTPSSRATLAYRATDLYAAMRGDPRIADAERRLCARADVIVATSEVVAAHLRALSGRQAHVISNGVDYAHFAVARELPDEFDALPGERASRAVYVGAFDARFCMAALRAAALALPGRTFMLAGPGSEQAATALALPNIHGIGPMPYETLPVLLHACAVGLLPFSADAANAGRSPMKLFEYAAAGLTIAATRSFRCGRTAMPTVSVAASTGDFARAVGAAFELSGDVALLERARESARAEDWAVKAAELLRVMQQARAEAALHAPAAAEAPPLRMRNSWN